MRPPGQRRRRPDLSLPIPPRQLANFVPVPSSLPVAHNPPTAADSASPPPPPLQELEHVRRLGTGTVSSVWMVRHRATGRVYALKVLDGKLDDTLRRHAARGVAMLRATEHPAIVRCHGMYEHDGVLQILFEYMDGGSLQGRHIPDEPCLANLARQVLSGIAYLHRRHIVHRDIKPSSLLIDTARRVKIADFGIARILNQIMDPVSSPISAVAYMSPERINPDLNYGSSDGYSGDIWSFGLIILELYLGRFPLGENFNKQGGWATLMVAICFSDPPELPTTASPELRDFIRCCLQKNPVMRPTAEQLLQHPFVARPQNQPLATQPRPPRWSEPRQHRPLSPCVGSAEHLIQSSSGSSYDHFLGMSTPLGLPQLDRSLAIDVTRAIGFGEDRSGDLYSSSLPHLEHVYFSMILQMLGIARNQKRAMPRSSFRATPTSTFGLVSAVDLQDLSVIEKSERIMHGSREPHFAMLQRRKLLIRGIKGITIVEDTNELQELPVFPFDDMFCIPLDKKTKVDVQRMPARVVDPLFFLPTAVKNLLCLDLSGCTLLTQVPASIGTLHNLTVLNLSWCYSLHMLSEALGSMQNLQILVLSCCHKLRDLPVSLCNLPMLRLLDLSGCFSLEILPDSFVNLGCLEILNLSDCNRLKGLPQPFGWLQELKYLNLSGCHKVDLDVEYLCKLGNLKCLTLSPHADIRDFPDSFQDLANCLNMLRWWKKNKVHPQCNPNAAALHSYRSFEQSIVDTLLSDGSVEGDATNDTVTSICIVGASGMGKTELLYRICNDQTILDTFNLRIWVPQLPKCDKKCFLVNIIELITCTCCSDAPLNILEDIVIEEITGKRLLLVLEDADIKNLSFWSDVRRLLKVCAKGSASIITTKSKEVPDLVKAVQTFCLSSLSKEECFMIFKGHVLGDLDMNDYPQLESVGWKVVEKCGGNALCVKALSGLLCHSELGLAEVDKLEGGVLPALRLCYDVLPVHLKHCFKFCSLFPKDYIFNKHYIIRLWIAHGFVLPKECSKPEDTALQYFDELFCRSFFQRSPVCTDQEDKFVMHELFHDLAVSFSKHECLRMDKPFCSLPGNISHLSLVLSDTKTVVLNKEVKHLLSFLVVRRSLSVARILHSNEFYVKYKLLRALNLSYTDILELPGSIGNLKHLRFLALNSTKIMGLPFEIGQLSNLQTLELKDCCNLIELPRSTTNLSKLQHLDLQKEPGNVQVAMPQGIGQLTNLQTLAVFNIGDSSLHCSIRELAPLNELRGRVQISGLENIKTAEDAREANMMDKLFIEALTLEWCCGNETIGDDSGKEITNYILHNLQPNSNVRSLSIQNYTGSLFPVWMQDSYLTKLVSVTFDNCNECSELPYFGDLPSLKYLCIRKMNAVESFVVDSGSSAMERIHSPRFPSLEVLTFREMYDLQFWVGTGEGDFPRLHRLCISRCSKLIKLPTLISLVDLSLHFGGQVPAFSELPSLNSLKIEGFHKIRSISFPHHLTTLKKLEIIDCKELLSMYAHSLSVSDLQIVRCLKLDLVGSSLDDPGQQIVGPRTSPTRRSMVLKTVDYTATSDDYWNWNFFSRKDIFGSRGKRSYYRCIRRRLEGCNAMKLVQPRDSDPNALSIMYIYEHNHEFRIASYLGLFTRPERTHLGLPTQLEMTRKRKQRDDVSRVENTSKKPL